MISKTMFILAVAFGNDSPDLVGNKKNLKIRQAVFVKFKNCAKGLCVWSKPTSEMTSSLWHALTHIVDSIRHVESMENSDAGFYESSHQTFRRSYKKHQ